jgi:aspartyl-tRNA(Asn)/glutamyl-tRNA(Gln) amidotransferase subunit C
VKRKQNTGNRKHFRGTHRVFRFPYFFGETMRLTSEEVDYIALLARLDLSPAEREREANELSQILDYFEKLKELDTEDVEPTSHVMPVVNVLRSDEARPSLPREVALQNAPEQAAGMFQVPRVVEAE